MKPVMLSILLLVPYLLSMGMGFPNLMDLTYVCEETNTVSEEQKSIKKLPIQQAPVGQKNSCLFFGCRANAVCFSFISKPSSMITFSQWASLSAPSMFHSTNANISFIRNMTYVPTHTVFIVAAFLQSLISCTVPLHAQVKVEKKPMEAVIYLVPELPFLVYVRLDNPQRQVISVSIYSEKNKLLFTERVTRYKYNFKLDLSQLPNGEYRVQVDSKQKVITKEISIRTLYEQKTQRIVSLSDLAVN